MPTAWILSNQASFRPPSSKVPGITSQWLTKCHRCQTSNIYWTLCLALQEIQFAYGYGESLHYLPQALHSASSSPSHYFYAQTPNHILNSPLPMDKRYRSGQNQVTVKAQSFQGQSCTSEEDFWYPTINLVSPRRLDL